MVTTRRALQFRLLSFDGETRLPAEVKTYSTLSVALPPLGLSTPACAAVASGNSNNAMAIFMGASMQVRAETAARRAHRRGGGAPPLPIYKSGVRTPQTGAAALTQKTARFLDSPECDSKLPAAPNHCPGCARVPALPRGQ